MSMHTTQSVRPSILARRVALALTVLALAARGASAQEPCRPSVVGDLRIERFTSTVYGREITVRIWLPPGYATGSHSYPTLYVLDGQGAFDHCTAFKGEVELGLDEAATALIRAAAIPPLIIVGVDSGTERIREYAPFGDPVTRPAAPEPEGKRLPKFLADEVMPLVARGYRVSKDAAQTGIGGCSLGASGALWVALQRPDLFGMALLQSPNLLLGNGELIRLTTHLARAPDRVAIGVGGSELDFPDIDRLLAPSRLARGDVEEGGRRMAARLADHLVAAYLKTSDVQLVVEPGANHSARYWAGRMPAALTFLYGTRPAGPVSRP